MKQAIDELTEMKGESWVDSRQAAAIDKAIKAMERIGYLVDRPCEACTFHGPSGCSKWSCVFEGDGE